MEDLEEAITYNHEALSLCPPGHPDRSMYLINLAIALFRYYKQLTIGEDGGSRREKFLLTGQ